MREVEHLSADEQWCKNELTKEALRDRLKKYQVQSGPPAEGEGKSRWINEDDPMIEWTN